MMGAVSMIRILWISIASFLLCGGCVTTRDGGNEPIVAPTVITNEVQDVDDPILPPYIPWWVE